MEVDEIPHIIFIIIVLETNQSISRTRLHLKLKSPPQALCWVRIANYSWQIILDWTLVELVNLCPYCFSVAVNFIFDLEWGKVGNTAHIKQLPIFTERRRAFIGSSICIYLVLCLLSISSPLSHPGHSIPTTPLYPPIQTIHYYIRACNMKAT